MKEQGIEKAREFYKKTNSDSILRQYYRSDEDQGAFTYAGYTLLDRKMFPEAIELFKFNLEQFPNSGYAYAMILRNSILQRRQNWFRKKNTIRSSWRN